MALVVLGGLVTSTLLSLFVVPALYLSLGGGPRPAVTPEDELMHRWAGVTPETAAAPAGANGEPLPTETEPRVVAETKPTGGGAMQGDGAPPGSPTHSGADSGIQTKGDE